MARGLRIGIDLTALLPDATGVDVYLLHLVERLGVVDTDNDYVVFINREDRGRLEAVAHPRVQLVSIATRSRATRLLAQQVALPLWCGVRSLDVLHSPSFITPQWGYRTRHVLTVHDMTSFSRPDHHIPLRGSAAYRAAARRSMLRADLVVAPSRHTRSTILEHVPELPSERVRVVPNGVGDHFRPVDQVARDEVLRRLNLPKQYVLSVGTIEPRKNLGRVLSAFRRLLEQDSIAEDLVLCGRLGWKYQEIVDQATTPSMRRRVHQIGYVADTDLPALYSQATAFLYPSLEEGFGFPPLEAMACGVPTIASTTSSLGENLRGAAILVEPSSTEEIASALARVVSDTRLRRELASLGRERAGRFRWDDTATQTAALYREVACATANSR